MPPRGRNRHEADELVIHALACGKPVRVAAEAAGVADKTVWRRLKDPAFKARIAEVRAAMLSAATGRLSRLTTRAVSTLESLLNDPDGKTRLGASKALLEQALRYKEACELEQRIAALEAGTLDQPPEEPPQ